MYINLKAKLTIDQKERLLAQVRKTRTLDEKQRISAILLYNDGKTVEEIAYFLFLYKDTVHKYIREFHDNDKTSNDPRGGSSSKLSDEQEEELIEHLSKNTYLKTSHIQNYILKKYNVLYKISGLTAMIHRLGFCYQKPKLIPGKLSIEKQEKFKEFYSHLKEKLTENEEILFMDSVHPEYQSKAVGGWILKGSEKHLQTTAKQIRLHFTGAMSLGSKDKDQNIIIHQSGTVNQDVVITFLQQIEIKLENKTVIHIICDNASYYKSNKVKEFLKTSKIKIHHLPPYSPNLNPIERLWKIFRECCCYNKYYEKFKDFTEGVNNFFLNISTKYKNLIKSRINLVCLDPLGCALGLKFSDF